MHTDDSILAALIGLAFGLVKIIEKGAGWWLDKKKEETRPQMIAILDPQSSAAIVQMSNKVENMHETMDKTDHDGIPMIYFPRSVAEANSKQHEIIVDKIDGLSLQIANQKR